MCASAVSGRNRVDVLIDLGKWLGLRNKRNGIEFQSEYVRVMNEQGPFIWDRVK
jgi:hypothetical protein